MHRSAVLAGIHCHHCRCSHQVSIIDGPQAFASPRKVHTVFGVAKRVGYSKSGDSGRRWF